MRDLVIDFTWYQDPKGYRLIPAKPVPSRDIVPARIIGNGGPLKSYRPLDDQTMFTRFAAIRSEQDVFRFVEKFGPLTRNGFAGRKGDVIPEIICQAEDMSDSRRVIAMALPKLDVTLVSDPINPITGSPRLKVSPSTLLDALWLQFAQARSAGAGQRCPQCHKWFMTGPDAGRRLNAKYCSVECKTKFLSLKRSR
jgi:hypothetical protein